MTRTNNSHCLLEERVRGAMLSCYDCLLDTRSRLELRDYLLFLHSLFFVVLYCYLLQRGKGEWERGLGEGFLVSESYER